MNRQAHTTSAARPGVEIGARFGRLTVIEDAGTTTDGQHHRLVRVRCDCGSAVKTVQLRHLKDRSTKGCGCLNRTQGESWKRSAGIPSVNK